ncbi:MAG: hypothetical protein MHM6MM_006573 [Cercozoa sp. M6MM]
MNGFQITVRHLGRRGTRFSSSVKEDEIAKFGRMAREWWDPKGVMAPLHQMHGTRMEFVSKNACRWFQRDREQHMPLRGLKALDVGCGGGIASESLARLGADTTGIDMAQQSLRIAQTHWRQQQYHEDDTGALEYQRITAEELAETHAGHFDLVVSLEVIEHVQHPAEFVKSLAKLLRPGGVMFLSTLNRTSKSYLIGIVGAEHVARVVPVGTHDWNHFVTLEEMDNMLLGANMRRVRHTGMVMTPPTPLSLLSAVLSKNSPLAQCHLDDADTDCNYLTMAVKDAL